MNVLPSNSIGERDSVTKFFYIKTDEGIGTTCYATVNKFYNSLYAEKTKSVYEGFVFVYIEHEWFRFFL